MKHKLENKVNSLVENILDDYDQARDIDIVKTFDHPDKEEIVDILHKLQGYRA